MNPVTGLAEIRVPRRKAAARGAAVTCAAAYRDMARIVRARDAERCGGKRERASCAIPSKTTAAGLSREVTTGLAAQLACVDCTTAQKSHAPRAIGMLAKRPVRTDAGARRRTIAGRDERRAAEPVERHACGGGASVPAAPAIVEPVALALIAARRTINPRRRFYRRSARTFIRRRCSIAFISFRCPASAGSWSRTACKACSA